jgi:calcium-dependent protein kinase
LTIEDKAALSTEIDIFKTVDHPNIVKLYEIFEDDESYSLVMELMTGGEVKNVLIIA